MNGNYRKLSFVSEANEMGDSIKKELEKLFKEINEIKVEIKNTVKSSKEELKKEINVLQKQIAELTVDKEMKAKEIVELREENTKLNIRIEELENYSRRDNIVIHGLPEEQNEGEEELLNLINGVADSPGVPLQPYEIHAFHRLPTKEGKNKPVIVKLNNRQTKARLVRRSKQIKLQNIFVNEYVSKQTNELFSAARLAKKDGKFQFVWLKEGQVFVRREERSQEVKVKTMKQLEELVREPDITNLKLRTRSQSRQKPDQDSKDAITHPPSSKNQTINAK